MYTTSTEAKKMAKGLIDTLVQLDKSTHNAYYEMGRILHTLARDSLWDLLGYESMKHLVEEELSYSTATASKYSSVYKRFREQKYTKNEALQMINQFGYTNMAYILTTEKQKLGPRAIQNRINARDDHQVNFSLNGKQWQEFRTVFEELGAVYTEKGRMANATQTLMEAIRLAKSVIRKQGKAA